MALGPARKPNRKDRRGEVRARQRLERGLINGLEHHLRCRERLGETKTERPEGPLVWIHCNSEEAALGNLPLVGRMRLERDDLNFLITTAEFDPSDPLKNQLPERCVHQYLPYGEGLGIENFLAYWQPDICLWLEPNLRATAINSAAEHDIPLFMADAALPDEKQSKLRWFPGTIRKTLGQFEQILAIDGRSARNFKRLGVGDSRVEVLGKMQEGSPPLDCVQSDRDEMAALLAARPVWLAAEISREEEKTILGAQRHVLRRSHRLLLILIPDDKARGPDLATDLEQAGWSVALRSAGQEPEPDTQIYVADLAHEMGLWLRLSPLVFMGNTLHGNPALVRDPFQPTALGSSVLHGPQHGVFSRHYKRLQAVGAARQVEGEKALCRELETLQAPDKVAEMARAAWEVSTSGAEVSDRISSLIFASLDARGI